MRINKELIRELRHQRGLSNRQLAKLAGIAASQISDLESGQLKNTTVDTICKLAEVLECNPSDLFTC